MQRREVADVLQLLLDSAGEEDKLEFGTVRGVTDLEHLVPGGVQMGLDLLAVLEAQRGLRRQRGTVGVEGPRPAQADQWPVDCAQALSQSSRFQSIDQEAHSMSKSSSIVEVVQHY